MDFLLVAFGTFLGAAVALAAERLNARRDRALAEEAAINNLILDLASKRAFVVPRDWVWGDGEQQRVRDSVFHARSLIRDTRLLLTARSPALPVLRSMAKACNSFLEAGEREDEDEEQLKSALRALAVGLSVDVQRLHSIKPSRYLDDAPGSFA